MVVLNKFVNMKLPIIILEGAFLPAFEIGTIIIPL
jgi:hypothetical protein